jgi:hypothetical protein
MENVSMPLRVSQIYGWNPKLKETWDDIQKGNLSMSRGELPTVAKLGGKRNAYMITNGYHRIMEDTLNGKRVHQILVDPHVPALSNTEGWRHYFNDSMKISDFIRSNQS